MSDAAAPVPTAPNPVRHSVLGWLLRDGPFLAMLVVALVGIGYAGFTGQPLVGFWAVLAPVYGLICVVAGWPRAGDGRSRTELIVTQALHWLAVLAAMYAMSQPVVHGALNDTSEGLTLLTLLALGTFLAGVHARAWKIGVVGLCLAAAVPAVAWFQRSSLLILMVVLLAVVVGLGFWFVYKRARAAL